MDTYKWRRRVAINVKEKVIDRQIEAHRLRYEEGLTYQDISDKLVYSSQSAAYNAVQAAIKFKDIERNDTLEQSRSAAIARLTQYIDDLQSKLGKGMNVISTTSSKGPKGKSKSTTKTYVEEVELKIYDKIFKAEAQLAKLQGTNQEQPGVNVTFNTHEDWLKDLK